VKGAAAIRPWPEIRRRAIELVAARPPLLVVTDFDGTISPINPDPLGAVIVPLARRAIRRLAHLADARPDLLSVVVLSGRASLDVAGRVTIDPALSEFSAPTEVLARGVAERLRHPDWLFVELKGPSVAFHFRQAPDADAAREAVLGAIDATEREAGGTGMIRFEGRKIVELRPAGAGGKGQAMERLLARDHPGAVLVMGDDVSDAEAMRIVVAARERGELDALALGVTGANETPPGVLAAADAILASPQDAGRVLATVASAVAASVVGHGAASRAPGAAVARNRAHEAAR
jgi:trehalose 6-phosphate phosphatase